jgi:hypothetical protein
MPWVPLHSVLEETGFFAHQLTPALCTDYDDGRFFAGGHVDDIAGSITAAIPRPGFRGGPQAGVGYGRKPRQGDSYLGVAVRYYRTEGWARTPASPETSRF